MSEANKDEGKVAVQHAPSDDAIDAARWRRLVNASEMPFPVLALADDPENDCNLIYGRKRLEEAVDLCDEIPSVYDTPVAVRPARAAITAATSGAAA